jgi:hypothetical protein
MSDHKVRSIEEITNSVKGVTFWQIVEVAMVLVGAGHMASVQSDTKINQAKLSVERLNIAVLLKAKSSTSISYLASPVTGGGVPMNRLQQLFLLSIIEGKRDTAEVVNDAWETLSIQNELLMKDGKPLATVDENLRELTLRVEDFNIKKLPILKALLVI